MPEPKDGARARKGTKGPSGQKPGSKPSDPRPRNNNNRRPSNNANQPKANRGQTPKRSSGGAVKVVFMGGLGEIGRNCAAFEIDGRIIILDCGIMFPDQDMPGIDLVLPDFSYLYENASRIDGIVITHGHEDHTGGLAYLLREVSAPIYGSELSLGLARNRIEEAGLAHRTSFNIVHDGERRRIGPCEVEFIPVTHSVPHAFAIAFHTSQGVVLHSGDFKIDLEPVDGRRTDLARMGAIAHDTGIRLLLSDSTNAEEPGYTDSETTVGVTLKRVFADHRNERVIVACFASHIHRVQQVVDAAVASGRRIFPLGRSMIKNIDLSRQLGLLQLAEDDLVDIERVDDFRPENICVVSTGSQGEPMAALSLMATGDNRRLKVGKGDVVIISAHPIPGNEWGVGRVIDQLHRRGAKVVHSGTERVHVSGHARRGELKTLISVTKPQYFIPVHGEFRHLVHHAELAGSMGITPDRVVLCEDGDVVRLDSSGLSRDGTVPAGYVYVDGTVGDIGQGVLRDRRVLSEEGFLMVVATVDLSAGQCVGAPEIATKGWVFASEADGLLTEAGEVVAEALAKAMVDGADDIETLQRHARKTLARFVNERTKRRPMILPVVIAV